jgi:hypothetical protein
VAKAIAEDPVMRKFAAMALALWPLAAASGVYSDYEVNGARLGDGATMEEIRRVAGEPLQVEAVSARKGGEIGEDWVYLCSRRGTGPCRTVAENGKRRMYIRLFRGRLESVRYEDIAG